MTCAMAPAPFTFPECPIAALAPDASVPTITRDDFPEGRHAGNFNETGFKALLIFG